MIMCPHFDYFVMECNVFLHFKNGILLFFVQPFFDQKGHWTNYPAEACPFYGLESFTLLISTFWSKFRRSFCQLYSWEDVDDHVDIMLTLWPFLSCSSIWTSGGEILIQHGFSSLFCSIMLLISGNIMTYNFKGHNNYNNNLYQKGLEIVVLVECTENICLVCNIKPSSSASNVKAMSSAKN